MPNQTTCHSEARELHVSMAVRNPHTGYPSRSFRFAGKVDHLIPMADGRSWVLVDYKCTTDPTRFIAQKALGYQADLYAMALEPQRMVEAIEFRIIEIPAIKFCSKDADAQAYQDRCYEWLMQPGKMVTHSLMLSGNRQRAAQQWLWDVSKRILDCRLRGTWLYNENACYTWNRPCEFLPLCTVEAEGRDVNWVMQDYEKHDRHEELKSDDRDILTYSSSSTMALCEKRYFWRYECALRQVRESYSGSLWMGSAVHPALEAFASGGVKAARRAIAQFIGAHPVLGDEAGSDIGKVG